MTKKVIKLLHDLSMSSKHKGFIYVLEGVIMICEDPIYRGNLHNFLYQELSDKYSTSVHAVEKCVRNAIEISWTNINFEIMIDIFGNSIPLHRDKPTNQEYLLTIADYLLFD